MVGSRILVGWILTNSGGFLAQMAFLASGDLLSFSAMLESGHWPSTLEVFKTLQESSLQVGPKGLRIDFLGEKTH